MTSRRPGVQTKGGPLGRGLGLVAGDRANNRKVYDSNRKGRADRSWYRTPMWYRKRRAQLRSEPHCRMHKAEFGALVIATRADHVVPHRGDYLAFWAGELQSLCEACHNRRKQADERQGFSSATGADGWPTDAAHPVNQPIPGRCEEL